MKVRLTRDTLVRFEAGTVLEVSTAEASRLFMLGNAVEVKEEKKAEKKNTKK